LLFAIPSIFNQFLTCLKLIATIMISASVVQMLSSSILIFTVILAVFFLKKKYYRHHYMSMFIIVGGMTLVGLSVVLNPKDGGNEHTATEMIIGLICL
jgi:drug/metabolite transporter (DMT)-like permease